MFTTSKTGIPYPVRRTREWFDQFEDMLETIDQRVYAAREDRNIVVTGGGNFTFNSTTGVLTWASPIEIFSPLVGFNWIIPAGNITVANNQIAYLTLTRAPTQNVTLSFALAANLSLVDGDAALLFGIRRGSIFYSRNGRVIANGDSFPLFEQSSTGGGGIGEAGQIIREDVQLSTYAPVDESTFTVIGAVRVNPADYTITGAATTARFKVVAAVTSGSLTGEVRLHNLTTATTISTLSWTETTPTFKDASITLTSGNNIYELQARVTGGTPPASQVLVYSSAIQIDRTIS